MEHSLLLSAHFSFSGLLPGPALSRYLVDTHLTSHAITTHHLRGRSLPSACAVRPEPPPCRGTCNRSQPSLPQGLPCGAPCPPCQAGRARRASRGAWRRKGEGAEGQVDSPVPHRPSVTAPSPQVIGRQAAGGMDSQGRGFTPNLPVPSQTQQRGHSAAIRPVTGPRFAIQENIASFGRPASSLKSTRRGSRSRSRAVQRVCPLPCSGAAWSGGSPGSPSPAHDLPRDIASGATGRPTH